MKYNLKILTNFFEYQYFRKLNKSKFLEIHNKTRNRTKIYEAFNLWFSFIEKKLIHHRKYFSIEKRGFGENAFHVMWYLLVKLFKPKNFLEIGVYRGQVLSLISYISKLENYEIEVYGISPFDESGDEVSEYIELNYFEDTIKNFEHFELSNPNLLKAFSTDKKAKDFIRSKKWDMVYIDGSHDYEVVVNDVEITIPNLSKGGFLIMDDSSLFTDYEPKNLKTKVSSFKGHEGPSKVFTELLKDKRLEFIIGVGHNNVFRKT